jgi:hypothetical protein
VVITQQCNKAIIQLKANFLTNLFVHPHKKKPNADFPFSLSQIITSFIRVEPPFLFLFFYLVCEAIGTAATPGLLCQPRVIVMIVESRWNVDWQGKPKFSEKTCPSATFVHHNIPHA